MILSKSPSEDCQGDKTCKPVVYTGAKEDWKKIQLLFVYFGSAMSVKNEDPVIQVLVGSIN